MTYQLKPQMRTLGKKYGKLLKAIGEKLATLDGNEVVAGFEKGELLRFELEGTMVELEKDDVLTAPMKKPGLRCSDRPRRDRRAGYQPDRRPGSPRALPAR